jgi:hypothetical protein
MSIATLKKKTASKYNNLSVHKSQISINGTRRSQGYVGQTSLSRSLPRTLMNGPTPRGNGGCCGNYQISPIVQSAVTSLNDPTVIKNSVINTNGMINEKMHGITKINQNDFVSCGIKTNCYNTVKTDNNQHLNNQGDYITNKAKKTIQQVNLLCNMNITNINKKCNNSCSNTDPFLFKGPSYINYTKPKSDYIPISQGEHLINKTNDCISVNKTYTNTTNNKTPFACGL